jgi:plasmid stability protein
MKPYWNLKEDNMAINITLKNIPPELHEELKKTAARHRRSLNSEILALLEERLRPRKRTPEEILAAAKAVREKMKGVWLTNEMIDEMKREGRE